MTDAGPWLHGRAECGACGHQWVAVWPLGADLLECPKCGSDSTDREQLAAAAQGVGNE